MSARTDRQPLRTQNATAARSLCSAWLLMRQRSFLVATLGLRTDFVVDLLVANGSGGNPLSRPQPPEALQRIDQARGHREQRSQAFRHGPGPTPDSRTRAVGSPPTP